ncbi:MAG: EamA family transporter [Dermatophilaceae bacterium]
MPWSQLDLVGIGLALLAGAFWAAYVVLSQRTGAAFPQLDGLAIAMVVALAFVAPFGLGSVGQWDGSVLVKGAAVAILSSVVPYSFELLALRSLSQQVFGILLSLEPAVAALAGFLVLASASRRHPRRGDDARHRCERPRAGAGEAAYPSGWGGDVSAVSRRGVRRRPEAGPAPQPRRVGRGKT